MKKFLIITTLFFASFQMYAQKTAYINTETILSQMPEYTSAQEKLKTLNDQYKSKVESELNVVEQMYNNYQAQKAGLSQSQRTAKENEIINKEKTVKELQKVYFGQDGYMQKKSDELLNPIKERVDKAIKKMASENGYAVIYDLSAMQGIVYSNPQIDLSTKVIAIIKQGI